MAKCDEGYLCEVCGKDVDGVVESDLYLRFVIGEIDPERLHTLPERHLNCNPILAQFIADDRFVFEGEVPDGFALVQLDEDYARKRRELVTRGWRRLHELAEAEGDTPIHEYPLPEARAKWS